MHQSFPPDNSIADWQPPTTILLAAHLHQLPTITPPPSDSTNRGMTPKPTTLWGTLFDAAGILCILFATCTQPFGGEPAKSNATNPAASPANAPADKEKPVTVATARDRAKLMHDVYLATLDSMHEHYFDGNRTMVPARAMEDVFANIKEKSKIQARWISVNMDPMNIDHEPKTAFEKRAATELADGKPDLEIIEGRYYRRAAPVPLASSCVSCHGGFFKGQSKTEKFAGLVISIPVTRD